MMNPAVSIESFLGTLEAQQITNVFLFLLIAVFLMASLLARWRRGQGFAQYAPTMLTSLGILGTFVGIVVGLIGFDIQAIDDSIGALLAGLKTAFITSLVGIFLAIMFKALETIGLLQPKQSAIANEAIGPEDIHRELRAQREAMEKLTRAMVGDEEATLITQIRLLRGDSRDQAQRTHALLEQQRVVLDDQKTLQTTLVTSIQTQAENFIVFREALWEKLDQFADMLSKSATEQIINALKEVIADFNRNLTEQFGDNFKELNAAVARLVEWQENYREQLEHMSAQYAQGVQAIAATESSVAHIREQAQQIPVAMGALKRVLDTTQHQLNELQRHLDVFCAMRDRAVEAVPQIRDQMDTMVTEVTAAVQGAGEHIVSASTRVNAVIVDSAQQFEQQVQQTNTTLSTTSERLATDSERAHDQLDHTLNQIDTLVRDMSATVVDNTRSIGNTLVESNRTLDVNLREVQSNVTDSIETMKKRLEHSLESIFQAQTQATSRAFQAIDEQLNKTVSSTGDAVNQQVEALDKAMQQELQRAIEALGGHLAAITRKFTEDYAQLTQEMAKVVDQTRQWQQRSGRVR